jgi:3alpha(or 20beta)-hydroxysteroid dehydrogenase
MSRLNGKTILISGAAGGMGAAHVRRLVAEGAKVCFTDLLVSEGQALERALGRAALFYVADVTKEADWQRVVAAAESAFGPINVLVNNAGLSIRNLIDETSEAEYRRIIDVNQVAVYLGMKAVIPSMRANRMGSIINVSSISGMVGRLKSLAYTASKFAVRGMTKVAANELGPYNVRANSIHPGPIESPMLGVLNEAELGALVSKIPLGRIGRPEEVSDLIVFLASDESTYISGSEFVIDGGALAT